MLFFTGLFPKATEYKSFNRVSNPYECDVAGMLLSFMNKSISNSIEIIQTK